MAIALPALAVSNEYVGRLKKLVMGAGQRVTVIMTCIKLNSNAPLVQQILKMLHS
jgi:hypothetical protein